MTPDLDQQTLASLLKLARDVARACGRLITDERPASVQVADTKSSAVDVVTEMDRRSEALAHRLIFAARPDDGLLGEEGLDRPSSSGISWVIDPIDGTVSYLYGFPGYSVSVAAVVGDPHTEGAWTPVVGAVYFPPLDELYYASTGGGAWLTSPTGGTQQLVASPAEMLAKTLVATGFGYTVAQRTWQGQAVGALLPQIRDIRRTGTAALDMCHVAAGHTDAYYDHSLNPWDMAAGWVVAAEAGLVVRGFDTDYPTSTLVVVGSEPITAAMVDVLRPFVPIEG